MGLGIADKATVFGVDPTGTVTFHLYDNANASGTPLYTDTENVSGGVATSGFSTATTPGTYYWVATYNGDSNNAAATSNSGVRSGGCHQWSGRLDGRGTRRRSIDGSFPAGHRQLGGGSEPLGCADRQRVVERAGPNDGVGYRGE